MCGLIGAVDTFDQNTRYPFSLHVTRWIVQEIRRAVWEQRPLVKPARLWVRRIASLRSFRREFLQEHGFAASDREVQEHFGLSPFRLKRLLEIDAACRRPVALGALVPCAPSTGPEQRSVREERRRAVEAVVAARLDRRRATVLKQRFGLEERRPQTLLRIGKSLGVTRERVRQIEARAIEILQHPRWARKLELYR